MTRTIADLPRRAAAYAVDVALFVVALLAVYLLVFAFGGARTVAGAAPVLIITGVIWVAGMAVMQGYGASLGMRAFGLLVEDEATGEPIGVVRGLMRAGVFFALCTVVVGYITVLFDTTGRRQGWHDLVGGAVVSGRGERARVMPTLPPRDVRAAEWLAAMSEPRVVTDTLAVLDLPESDTVRVHGEEYPPATLATVVWDDGAMTTVSTRTIFGRNPLPAHALAVVAVADSTMSLSKTHFEITPTDAGTVVIVDLHSTNGVNLRRDGVTSVLVPGHPLVLRSGDIVEIGPRRARVEVSA